MTSGGVLVQNAGVGMFAIRLVTARTAGMGRRQSVYVVRESYIAATWVHATVRPSIVVL